MPSPEGLKNFGSKAPTSASAVYDTVTDQLTRLDQAFHAPQGRLNSGLSAVGEALAFMDWATHLANAPFYRAGLTRMALEHWGKLGLAVLGETAIRPDPSDHRFADPRWQAMPFSVIQQGFLLTEAGWAQATEGPAGISRANQRIVSFAARQWLDMVSPANIACLDPEVLVATIASKGRNLVDGFHNLLTDAQEALSGRPADRGVLVVGRDLAATPGKVVFATV